MSDADRAYNLLHRRKEYFWIKMEVIILAGGLGTRLRSEVADLPKCMAPIGGKPFLEYILDYLNDGGFGVSKVVLSVGYLRDIIMDWVNLNKNRYPFNFEYAIEDEPAGTGGGIRMALAKCDSYVPVVLNGDTFFNIDLKKLVNLQLRYNPAISIALKPMSDFDRYGRVLTNANNHIVESFLEKAYCECGLINGGVYALNKSSLLEWMDVLPYKFSFEKDVLEKHVNGNKICGFEFKDYFIDIGVPEDYHKAQKELKYIR